MGARRVWSWGAALIAALAFAGYQYENSAPRARASLEANLAAIAEKRALIAADRIQRAAEDASLRNRVRNLTGDDKALLDDGEALIREIEDAQLQSLDESERRARRRLSEVAGR